MNVKLNREEFEYLYQGNFMTHELLEKITKAFLIENDFYLLEISDEDADTIRDICGEQLQKVGFDGDYNPTREGNILERLIDKFYG